MKRYRGRAPLPSRAHDRPAAAGRRPTLAPARGRLKRRKRVDYFVWKHTSERISKLSAALLLGEPVQQNPLPPVHQCCRARTELWTPNAPTRTFQLKVFGHPRLRRMETPLLAALVPLTCCVSAHFQFSSSTALTPQVFLSRHLNYSVLWPWSDPSYQRISVRRGRVTAGPTVFRQPLSAMLRPFGVGSGI